VSDDLDLDDSEQQLVRQLRALPREGQEPDWAVLERQIRLAVGPQVPTSWWRKLRWLVPAGAIVTGAAVALLVMNHHGVVTEPTTTQLQPLPTEQPSASTTALWLDGHAVEVDDDFDPSTLYDDDGSEELAADSNGLLPVDNLQWIDSLDDRALDRAEHWLDHAKHKKG
jgi:hypothetical protein